ncbi:hypothetical protein NMY22_g2818 [Coprinellus aureogranulatus]|nr:hypothetical protein NMY22_g2818 [Coprinellus aureogranulatus]
MDILSGLSVKGWGAEQSLPVSHTRGSESAEFSQGFFSQVDLGVGTSDGADLGTSTTTTTTTTTGSQWSAQSETAQRHWMSYLFEGDSSAPFASDQRERVAISALPRGKKVRAAIIEYTEELPESENYMWEAYKRGKEGVPIFVMQCIGYDPHALIKDYYHRHHRHHHHRRAQFNGNTELQLKVTETPPSNGASNGTPHVRRSSRQGAQASSSLTEASQGEDEGPDYESDGGLSYVSEYGE